MQENIIFYRCKQCGKVSISLGWLHGHIEKHRPLYKFWKTGNPKFLMENTEIIEVTEYKVLDNLESIEDTEKDKYEV